ncbi:MAG: hypothetical protein K2N72_02240, partial [Oscillospiraceae bacterium]|nr:hypothetical protein [Oscillospiraceae bacterium]
MKKILPLLLSAILSISLASCKNEQPGEAELLGNDDDVIIIEITTAPISETLTETEAETETSTTTAKTATTTTETIETTSAEKITTSAATTATETTVISTEAATTATAASKTSTDYILNTNTKKFHYPRCSSVGQMSDKHKREYSGARDDLIAQG